MTEAKTQKHNTQVTYHNFSNPTLLSREELHRTFGGILSVSDFDTEISVMHNSESKMAGRILTSWRIDLRCERNLEARGRRNI